MESILRFFEILIHSDQLIHYGGMALLVFVIFAETGIFFGFIFPGDALLFTAGIFCGTDDLKVNIVLLECALILAAIAGNLTGYVTGRLLGKRLFTREDGVFFKKKHLDTTHLMYEKYGGISLIAGRFIWVVRTFVPILAGAIEMNFWKFNYFNVIGAVLWVGSLVTMGYLLGKEIPSAAQNIEYIVAIITIVVMTILVRGIIKARKQNKG